MIMDFESAVEEARGLEKSALSYSAFKGKIQIGNELDLSPKEFAEYTYRDMINLYDRTEKIIKASGMEIYAPSAPPKKAMKAKTEEVESKVKEITGEALKSAEELGKELEEKPVEEAKPEEVKPAPEKIEFERLAPEEFEEEKPPEIELEKEEEPEIELAKEIEIEEKEAPEIELEKPEEKPPEIEIEKPEARPPKEAPKIEVPEKKARPTKPAVPPVLRERAEVAGSRRYQDIEEQIMATLGEKVDEISLKKKMLELTKELFKEKSVNKRERIKLEITVLKDMLKRKVKPPRKGMEEKEVKGRLLDTLESTQMKELASEKDKILTDYKHQVDTLRNQFMEKVESLPEDDKAGRKEAYEKMVFELTTLSEQLPQVILKHQNYLKEKHETEISKLKSSLDKKEMKLSKKADIRLKAIEDEYAKEFGKARAIIRKQIDTVIESSSRVAFKEEKVPVEEAEVQELVREINETDEGTLLYFLHGKEPEFYKKYERKHLSKQEAIFRAKALMAKEKGLSDGMISKYFSDKEG